MRGYYQSSLSWLYTTTFDIEIIIHSYSIFVIICVWMLWMVTSKYFVVVLFDFNILTLRQMKNCTDCSYVHTIKTVQFIVCKHWICTVLIVHTIKTVQYIIFRYQNCTVQNVHTIQIYSTSFTYTNVYSNYCSYNQNSANIYFTLATQHISSIHNNYFPFNPQVVKMKLL